MSVPPADAPLPETALLLAVPALDVRWVHAGAQQLNLLPTPITSASNSYEAFSESESSRIELRWQSISESDRLKTIKLWGRNDGEGAFQSQGETIKQGEKIGHDEKVTDGSKGCDSISRHSIDGTDAHSVGSKVKSEDGEEHLDPDVDDMSSGEDQINKKYHALLLEAREKNDDLDSVQGVPVSQDSLFEVSLSTLSLHPVFWAHTGPRVAVLRGTWFVNDESRPCCWELAEELEKAFLEIQPWQQSYSHELATALSLGSSGEEKIKYTLPSKFGEDLGIIFEDSTKGRIVTSGTLTYITRLFWSSLKARPAGTYVYRGYSAARSAKGKPAADTISTLVDSEEIAHVNNESNSYEKDDTQDRHLNLPGHKMRSQPVAALDGAFNDVKKTAGQAIEGVKEGLRDYDLREEQRQVPALGDSDDERRAVEEENAPLVHDTEDSNPCTDLILVVHGIGQQLAAQYEAYNFVYAGNQLRQVLRKQTSNPAVASIIRDRRCQVLPMATNRTLTYLLTDITIHRSIPYVRELTNSVLLDIPLFMSHHRQKMIEAVCTQANKLYRLWIARNPHFEEYGRVHIIAHSLGSALVAHILSNQPTKMPRISQLPKQVISETRDRFLFNISNLFLVGSPLGIFLHLEQAQLMPRKGRERTMHSPADEALDRAGRFGCLAVDSLYNVFYHTDPVAYQLNAAVDSQLASQRPPLAITSMTAPFYAPVADSINSISKYLPVILGGGGSNDSRSCNRPGIFRLPSGIEMAGPDGEEKLQGSRGERRFSALNPHGNVDFFLPSAGVNEYLDMLTAHLSYWTDSSFAAFLLTEIFSTRLDVMRTGMGLAHQPPPENGVDVLTSIKLDAPR
ncbi:phospholipase [Cryptococcus deuterogattii R265]|uniref:phospholipase n=1 Tax=Cryptococcus deuterogattii (strain R265) TaxID=294750 RepID=UPI00193538D2|nr:phospholipase [Cryptococcus deuterogattii R265]